MPLNLELLLSDDKTYRMTQNLIKQKREKSCLIIAAGKGTRLRAKGDSKPLTPILGVPLIERVIVSAMEAGVKEFFVVTGYKSEFVKSFLLDLSHRLGILITSIHNIHWEKENGLSVLQTRQFIREPFLLLMADHLFDPEIARELMSHALSNEEVVLAVDHNMLSPLVDLDDVTRVNAQNGKILAIGKNLQEYNAFDTGIFHCGTGIFETLEQCYKKNGNASLSQAIQRLANENRAKTFDIAGRFWIDIDTPEVFKQVENLLRGQQEKLR